MNRDTFEGTLEKAAKMEVLAVDTEGYSELDNKMLAKSETVGISVAGLGFEEYFPFNHIDPKGNLPGEWLQNVKNLLENHPRLVFHSAKHDVIALRNVGIKVGKYYDTMLMSHMIDENQLNYSLNWQSQVRGGYPKNRPEVMSQLIKLLGWAYIPASLMSEYAAWDARITWDLLYELLPDFQSQGFDGPLWDQMQEWSNLIGDMELLGVRIDTDFVEQEIARGERIQRECVKFLGLEPNGSKNLHKLLIDELGLPPIYNPKNKTRKPSFDKNALAVYDELLSRSNDVRARKVLEYRGWVTALGLNYRPYLERLSPDGRIRCNYQLHGTVSSRLSSKNPNLQQIPRNSPKDWNGKLKQAFIGEDGWRLWGSDFAQLEFRLGAAYAKEQRLLEVFNDPNRDIFNEISSDIKMLRQEVKTLTYTIQFGGGVRRIADVFGVSAPAAKALRDRYYITYPGLRKASDLAALRCKQQGYINMWSGRRRHFSDPESQAHKAFNAAIQGGAAEIVKQRMIALKKITHPDECRMLLQIHDEVVFEIREGLEHKYLPRIKEIMEDVKPNFGVRFKVDVHEWGK